MVRSKLWLWLVACLALALPACGSGDDGPRWVRLAKGHRPYHAGDTIMSRTGWPTVARFEPWTVPFGRDRRMELEFVSHGSDDDPYARELGTWASYELNAEDWTRHESLPDTWQVLRPLVDEGAPGGGDAKRLNGPGGPYEYVPFSLDVLRDPDGVKPKTFCGLFDQLYLKLGPGETPPDGLEYAVYLSRGRSRDGHWRVSMGRYQCEGLPVWPGLRPYVNVRLREPVAPGSTLRFTTLAMANGARGRDDADLEFAIQVHRTREFALGEGEEIFKFEQPVSDVVSAVRHEVEVPEGDNITLSFSVRGPAAMAAFGTPVLGPTDVGRPGERPWEGESPRDLVLFLADTFRADAMAAYGGELGVTPALDRLAERSVLFTRAWSPSSWTLPAQASMLTGLLPYQHGAHESTTALPEEAETLAEVLGAAGYRTAAVTDAAFLSHRFQMDQGFEWFDEIADQKHVDGAVDPLVQTLERVDDVLAADDGRPLFLWVQTYRVHFPYLVSDETREAWGDRLRLDVTWRDTEAEVRASGWDNGTPIPDRLVPVAEVMRDLYLGGVVDFDRIFGEWFAGHESAGRFDHAALLFTSDHGEAFGEHRDLYHGASVWESQIRVPMFLFGGGLEARRVTHAASLVDLPRTFVDLAGVEPSRRWGGTSLLTLDRERAVYAFETGAYETASQAILENDRKLLLRDTSAALMERDLSGAYDLGSDPGERTNVLREDGEIPAWVEELGARLLPEAARLRKPMLPGAKVELTADDRDELEKLGYTE